MSSILLTGATGFLGSHIADALAEAGHRLRCTVRTTSDTRWIDPLGVETVVLDLAPRAGGAAELGAGNPPTPDLSAALSGVEAVVHCGGLTRARDEARFMAVNAAGTERLVRAAARAGVGRFVLISSLAARGPDGARGPVSPYGRSKAAGEAALRAGRGEMSAVTLRPGGIYGPRDSDLLPLFRLASRGWVPIPSGGIPLQPIYVADVVSAVVAALQSTPRADPLPLAGERTYSWRELAGALAAAVGRRARILSVPPGFFWAAGLLAELKTRVRGGSPAMDRRRARDMSVHSWTCDPGPTRAALGWGLRVDIDEGLARTADWYRAAGWL